MVQDEGLALPERELLQRFEEIQHLWARRRRLKGRTQPNKCRDTPTTSPKGVCSQVQRDPAYPSFGRIEIPQTAPPDSSPGKGLLADVLGVLQAPRDRYELTNQPTVARSVELLEPPFGSHHPPMTDRPRSLTVEHTARRVRVAPFCAASSAADDGSQIPRTPEDAAAQAFDREGPIRVRPPDPFDLDRDGDGVGCES
jgi:hypothetical protein